jgi:hypothetical protein
VGILLLLLLGFGGRKLLAAGDLLPAATNII